MLQRENKQNQLTRFAFENSGDKDDQISDFDALTGKFANLSEQASALPFLLLRFSIIEMV